MENRTISAGQVIAGTDDIIERLYYISDGTVAMSAGGLSFNLKKGDFIGLADFDTGFHSFTYHAVTDVTLIDFSTRENLYKTNFYSSKPENSRAIALSINHCTKEAYRALSNMCERTEQISELADSLYSEYKEYAKKLYAPVKAACGYDEMPETVSLTFNQRSIYNYHQGISALLSNKDSSLKLEKLGLIPGYMLHAAADLHEAAGASDYIATVDEDFKYVLMNGDENDLFARMGEVYLEAVGDESLAEQIKASLDRIEETVAEYDRTTAENRMAALLKKYDRLKKRQTDEENGEKTKEDSIADKLEGSLNQIYEFCSYPDDKAETFREAIEAYKGLKDPYSTEDYEKQVRRTIEEGFYTLYLAVLDAYLEREEVPNVIRMFLNFGYVDEELAGMDNAYELYNISENLKGAPEKGVFLGFEWLLAIYTRKRNPGINEFDQTFEQFVKEQADNGKIRQSDMKLYLNSRGQMVMFEMQNMFRRASRMCSGQVLAFCPVFSAHQVLGSPDEDLTDPSGIRDILDSFRKIDFSLFYREKVCVYSQKDNIHDQIHVEVLPDMILLPIVGSRGVMWQEIAGRDRVTPARFLFPVISNENIDKIMLRVLAEYRWEICKRMQGSRWNDVTDPSLTSLYYDYLQFYRKNSEISQEQREKIRLNLQKCKNNFKECFILDYNDYIRYESQGAPHLTKAARAILYAQCPFSATIRLKLCENPIYAEINDRYRIKVAQQAHRLDNICKKLAAKGEKIPKELEREMAYIEM